MAMKFWYTRALGTLQLPSKITTASRLNIFQQYTPSIWTQSRTLFYLLCTLLAKNRKSSTIMEWDLLYCHGCEEFYRQKLKWFPPFTALIVIIKNGIGSLEKCCFWVKNSLVYFHTKPLSFPKPFKATAKTNFTTRLPTFQMAWKNIPPRLDLLCLANGIWDRKNIFWL